MLSAKYLIATGIVSLLQVVTIVAHAQGNDTYISCGPRVPFIGEITKIEIKRGPINLLPVEFTEGSHMNSSSASYVVRKTESLDLNLEHYNGPGFSLTVDVEENSANLTAVLDGHRVKLSNLICTFNENDPHPGVTMSN